MFKPGEKIICIDDSQCIEWRLKLNEEYTVVECKDKSVQVKEIGGFNFLQNRFTSLRLIRLSKLKQLNLDILS